MKEIKEEQTMVATLDGNEACAYIAYRVNEVCAIYPLPHLAPWRNLQMNGRKRSEKYLGQHS